MARPALRVQYIAMVLVTVVVLGALTPVCAMPLCDDTSMGTCSDYKPACDDCPETVVMKHVRDEATALPAYAPPALIATDLVPVVVPAPVSRPVPVPDQTASPPPLDPLGVRLTV
jgi:hypothetical protein